MQLPFTHWSGSVQLLVSLQLLPSGNTWSIGQKLLIPSQTSARSQLPLGGRQTELLFTSKGQSGLAPVQNSSRSHDPAAGRQRVPGGSIWQLEEQQSPSCVLPSSHCSPRRV